MRLLKLCLPLLILALTALPAVGQSPPTIDPGVGASAAGGAMDLDAEALNVSEGEAVEVLPPWHDEAPTPEVEVIVKSGGDAFAAVKYAFAHPSVITVAGATSAVLLVLISALRRWGPLVSWLTGERIRVITLLVGVVAAIATGLSTGATWLDAVFAGLSGPGALLLHQYLAKPLRRSPATSST